MPHIESKGKEKAALGAFFFILLIASYVSQAGLQLSSAKEALELLIFSLPIPECQDYTNAPSHLVLGNAKNQIQGVSSFTG